MSPIKSNQKFVPVIVVVILCLIWSSTWMAIKVGLNTMPPFLSAGWRFFTAFLVLLVFVWKRHLIIPMDLRSHLFFVFFGVINFSAGYGLVYWGEQYINSGLASILFSVMPFYVALLAIKMLPSEQVNLKKFIGITVGFLGVVVIFKDQLRFSHPMAIYGMLAVLLSPGFSGLGTIVGKKARDRYHPVTLNTFPLLYTSLFFLILHLLFEPGMAVQYTSEAIISILYLGIFGTAVAFVLYFWLLKTVSAVMLSLITFVTPPLALLWGWFVLGETISLQLVFGMLIIFAGILMVRRS